MQLSKIVFIYKLNSTMDIRNENSIDLFSYYFIMFHTVELSTPAKTGSDLLLSPVKRQASLNILVI
jgi:hypothetical protein